MYNRASLYKSLVPQNFFLKHKFNPTHFLLCSSSGFSGGLSINMGSQISTAPYPNHQNPSKPPNPPNPDSKIPDNQNPDAKSPDDQNPVVKNQSDNQNKKGQITDEKIKNGDEEEEEEGECGFCLFMKGGGCKDQFIAWEKCVQQAEINEEDIVDHCFQVTDNLKKCMEVHSDYYEPVLRIEKEAKQESEKKNDEQNA